MDDNSPMFLKNEAINSLNEKLKLSPLSPFAQDWEYEQTDSTKVQDFISFYENNQLSNDEKFALMKLIVASFDDYLTEGYSYEPVGQKVQELLYMDYVLHFNTIIYWALEDEELEDCFAITPFMRSILNNRKPCA